MPPYPSTPRDWPRHLNKDAEIMPVCSVPPAGQHLLDFTAMSPTTFEQFCWWLLQKDHSLVGCKRLGRNGLPQDGVDIFAYDKLQPKELTVFECKCSQNYKASNLREAVDAFLDGYWSTEARRFILILAQKELGGPLGRRWTIEKARMEDRGYEADIWTGDTLTLMAQSHPDILVKFFPSFNIQHFANEWMQRTGFIDLLHKANFDPRDYIAERARAFLDGTSKESGEHKFIIDGEIRKTHKNNNSWYFQGPWLSMHAILPSQRFHQLSAAINFKHPDMTAITITVDHNWMLKQLLFASNAPLINRYRGFIVNHTEAAEDEDYLIDLANSRLMLPKEGVAELAGAADSLTIEVEQAIKKLEAQWGAKDFPFLFYGGRKIALAALAKDIWNEIVHFTHEHDFDKGESQWHIFDYAPNFLKPYTKRGNIRFNAGYHGVFFAVEDIDGLSGGNDIVLLWQPDETNPERALSERDWWPCDFAFKWLQDELLPEVKKWIYNRSYCSLPKRIIKRAEAARFQALLNDIFVLRDLRQQPLYCNGEWASDVTHTVASLQRFFHVQKQPEPFIGQEEVERLYLAAKILAKYERGYIGYISTKLLLRSNPEDHAEIIAAIDEHIAMGYVVASAGAIDYVLRALLELIDDGSYKINQEDLQFLHNALIPFAKAFDTYHFVKRHLKTSRE